MITCDASHTCYRCRSDSEKGEDINHKPKLMITYHSTTIYSKSLKCQEFVVDTDLPLEVSVRRWRSVCSRNVHNPSPHISIVEGSISQSLAITMTRCECDVVKILLGVMRS